MNSHEAFEADVAAYALDALDRAERKAFEAHLATCARCQAELVDLRRVAAALGSGVERVEPPAALKAATIRRATEGRQSQPVPTVGAVSPRAEVKTGRSPLRWLAAAAALFVIAGLGAYALMLRAQVVALRGGLTEATEHVTALRLEVVELRRDSARLARTLSVLGAPTVLRVDLRGQSGASGALGRAYVGGSEGLVFAATGLPALPTGEIYQLWVISPDAPIPISAGVFPVNRGGDAAFSIEMPPGATVVSAVAVSVEKGPDGSREGPKGAIVLMGKV